VAFAIHFLGLILTPNAAESIWVLAGTGAVGVATAIPTWLAFMPPAAYRRWVVARAETAAPAAAAARPLAPRWADPRRGPARRRLRSATARDRASAHRQLVAERRLRILHLQHLEAVPDVRVGQVDRDPLAGAVGREGSAHARDRAGHRRALQEDRRVAAHVDPDQLHRVVARQERDRRVGAVAVAEVDDRQQRLPVVVLAEVRRERGGEHHVQRAGLRL